MFEIREIASVEAPASLWGSLISCAGTWVAVGLLWTAAAC